MDPTCIKKVIMQNPWNPWLLFKVPTQLQRRYSLGGWSAHFAHRFVSGIHLEKQGLDRFEVKVPRNKSAAVCIY